MLYHNWGRAVKLLCLLYLTKTHAFPVPAPSVPAIPAITSGGTIQHIKGGRFYTGNTEITNTYKTQMSGNTYEII